MAFWILKCSSYVSIISTLHKTSSLVVLNEVRWMPQTARKHHVSNPSISVHFIIEEGSEMISIVATLLPTSPLEYHASLKTFISNQEGKNHWLRNIWWDFFGQLRCRFLDFRICCKFSEDRTKSIKLSSAAKESLHKSFMKTEKILSCY